MALCHSPVSLSGMAIIKRMASRNAAWQLKSAGGVGVAGIAAWRQQNKSNQAVKAGGRQAGGEGVMAYEQA